MSKQMDKEIDFKPPKKMKISDYFDCYPFTHEQAYEIKNILERKFDPKNVDEFIEDLRFCCEGATCLLNQSDFKTYKNDWKSMMALLEKSAELLDQLRKSRGISYFATYSSLMDDKRGELGSECQELALITGDLLSILIRKIKQLDDSNEQRIKGRPNADNKGIIAEISNIWEIHFGKKPTKYRDGPFAEVVQLVLDGLRLPSKDPTRAINAALKK